MQHTTFTFRAITKLFIALFFVAFATGLYAQASLSVQGVLTKSDGTAVDDGTYTVTFKLFDAATGGNEVHSEPIDIETIGGVYSAVLGQNPSYPMNAPFNKIYYLSVRVGSSELLPRPQLTHSPYALSLLGDSNKFPSTGRVEADYIVVPDGEPLGAVAGKGYSFSGIGDADGGMFSKNDNNVSLWANGVKKIEISNTSNSLYGSTVNFGPFASNDLTVNGNETNNGNVQTNGSATITGNLNVNGDINSDGTIQILRPVYLHNSGGFGSVAELVTSGNPYYRVSFGPNFAGFTGNYSLGDMILDCDGSIRAKTLVLTSDKRIKRDIEYVKAEESLAKLRKFHVADYHMIDVISNGNTVKKGLIAQEVEQIAPEAVTTSTDFIPNVYDVPESTQCANSELILTMKKPHGLAKGDKVLLYSGASQKTLVVKSATPLTFTVANWDTSTAPPAVFVFGKEVSDFKAVDYNWVFNLNVAATQALAAKIDQLESEKRALQQANEALKQQQSAFSAQLSELSDRMKMLEKSSTDTGKSVSGKK